MLTGFIRNVIPVQMPRPRAYCERVLTAAPGVVTDQNIGLLGSPDERVYVHLRPEGARWPDGSHRFLRASFLASNLPGADALPWEIRPLLALPAFAWRPSDWIQPSAFWTFSADGVGQSWETWLPADADPTCVRLLHRTRFGPGGHWWSEVEYDAVHQLDAVPFRLRFGFSDPRVPDMAATLTTGVQADIEVATIPVLHSGARGASMMPHVGQHGYTLRLLGRGTVVDGQAVALRGTLLMMPPSLVERVPPAFSFTPENCALAMGQMMEQGAITPDEINRILGNWSETAAVVRCVQTGIEDGSAPSPLPFLCQPPPWINAVALSGEADKWAQANMAPISGNVPFQRPRLGHLTNPEGTGSQTDLGLQHWEQSVLGWSALADEAACRSVEYEAGRPSHMVEADLSPITVAGHPQCRFWGGRPHFSPSESPDRLGKGIAALPTPPGNLEQRGWEHFTINYVFSAWLAGDRLAREELLHLERIWTLTAKGVVPQSFLNSPGAARHTARFIWSGLQMHMATGSQQTLDLCAFRASRARPSTGPVGTVLAVRDPAANFLPNEKSWVVYEESDAACTLYALAQFLRPTDPSQAARYEALAWEILRMVIRFGYRMPDCVPATAVAWNNGIELTPEQLADPQFRVLFPGSDYQWWIFPGVLLGRKLAIAKGDTAIVDQANIIIQRVLASRRQPPSGPAWDDKGTWLPSVPQGEQVP